MRFSQAIILNSGVFDRKDSIPFSIFKERTGPFKFRHIFHTPIGHGKHCCMQFGVCVYRYPPHRLGNVFYAGFSITMSMIMRTSTKHPDQRPVARRAERAEREAVLRYLCICHRDGAEDSRTDGAHEVQGRRSKGWDRACQAA